METGSEINPFRVGDEVMYHGNRVKVERLLTGKVYISRMGRYKWVPEGALTIAEARKGRNCHKHKPWGYSAKGHAKRDKGDAAALMLRQAETIEEVYTLCESRGVPDVPAMIKRHAHLNAGQKRMLAGTALRKLLKSKLK